MLHRTLLAAALTLAIVPGPVPAAPATVADAGAIATRARVSALGSQAMAEPVIGPNSPSP